jgi:hypothetical protein
VNKEGSMDAALAAFIMSGLYLVFPGLAAILRQNSPLIA